MNRSNRILVALTLGACALGAVTASAQPPAPATEPRTIHVDAQGTVRRTPDQAVIILAVETTAATAAEASDRNAERMSAVLEAIRGLGVGKESVRTTRVDLYPQYANPQPEPRAQVQPQEPRITGYVATNQVLVTLDDVGRVGRVVDAGIAAGANRVNGIEFRLSDPEAAHREALRLAIENARREARTVADALDEPLGPPLSVTTSAYGTPPPQPFAARVEAFGAQAVQTPVEPGELEVRASVSITFRIGS